MISRLGDFEILHALKSGGMGDVLLARRRGPGGFEQIVAVKTIRPELTASEAVRTMFLDEARLLARLTHPAIATVHDFGDEGGTLYLALEYVRGSSFRGLGAKRPPPAIAARAIAEACRGLHAAHELRDHAGAPLGVVHRDISPENLMLGYDGQVKVLDFGIALVKGRMTVTEHGTIKGKPPYMSPEQVRNQPLDRRSDVWSVALILHELLTGKPVFDGDSIYAVARAVMEAPIPPPSSLAGPLPPGLDAAVMNALVRDPAGRTPTAAAFADELERIAALSASESLATWTERTFAMEREAHRGWLATLLTGPTGASRIGRASGQLTARSQPEPEPEPEPAHPPRKRRTGLAILLLLVLIAAAVFLLTRRGSVSETAPDAAAVATASVPDAAAAAAPDAAPAADAAPAPTADAAAPVLKRDAGVPRERPIDAAAPATVDAAPPAGTGKLTITSDPFSLVEVDGKSLDSTPIYGKKIAAGTHTVVCRAPDSGAEIHTETVEIVAGELTKVKCN